MSLGTYGRAKQNMPLTPALKTHLVKDIRLKIVTMQIW